jgi:pimeloyl-[acyl-carrier protein] methyl ester esterase
MSETLPVVVVPGLDGSIDLRRAFLASLERTHPVTFIAYPGSDILDYPALEARIRERLPDGRFVIIGESFGGPAAIRIADEAGARVAGVVLVASFASRPWPGWLAPATALLDGGLAPPAFLDAILLGDRANTENRQALHAVVAAMPPIALKRRAAAALRTDARHELARLTCPVLCIHSPNDWLIPPRCAQANLRSARCGEVVWIEGAHDLLLTHPEETSALIEAFCARL